MSSLINWEDLKPYRSDQKKSFEELCYQITYERYQGEGVLSSIDDSGGGDGVEFYIEFPNGDIWGWQCKFFGRFDEGGGKEQIKKSLKKAGEVHGSNLKKWILCSKLSLTPNERNWFYNKLDKTKRNGEQVLPDLHSITLDHWGESEILNFLRIYPDIHKYFFSEKMLDLDWFKKKFELILTSSVIKAKYLNGLHIEGQADTSIARVMCDERLITLIKEHAAELDIEGFAVEFSTRIKAIENNENAIGFMDDYETVKKYVLSRGIPEIIDRGNQLINKSIELIEKEEFTELDSLIGNIKSYVGELDKLYSEYSGYKLIEKIPNIHWNTEEVEENEDVKNKIKKCRETILGPYFTLRNYVDSYQGIFYYFEFIKLNELHITGKASKGKTHLAVNTVEYQINKNKPAIFLFGKDFKSDMPFREQLRTLLDIPSNWSVSDLLGALNISGRIHKTKVILLIDGLNEAYHWKKIWSNDLEAFINEINQNYPHILFITTYRSSYEKAIFPENYFKYGEGNYKKKARVDGFENFNLDEAIDKYFKYYKITLENRSGALNSFREPLYLKIFCEAKQGQKVSFQNEDLFDVFDQYIKKSNDSVLAKLEREPRFNRTFLFDKLSIISNKLWNYGARDIDLTEVVPSALSEDELIALEREDLLIFRDFGESEVVTFTYDLLSGYFIAKSILNGITSVDDCSSFISSSKFYDELLVQGSLHPLYSDILRCFCVLAIKKFGLKFYKPSFHNRLTTNIVKALFEVSTNIVVEIRTDSIRFISDVFTKITNRSLLFNLFSNTEFDNNHPLNMNLLSDLLLELPMAERDLTWTEYIRKEYLGLRGYGFKKLIQNFEEVTIKEENHSERLHLASKKIMWFLTSTNKDMRDFSTKALYYYGKKYINKFFELVIFSLKINDPYVSERMLASLYGIVIALFECKLLSKGDKEDLKNIGLKMYELIFQMEAECSTTHILTREYARRIIDIAYKHCPNLLSKDQYALSQPPYSFGGIRDWGEYDYGERDYHYESPLRMDFSNYTLGRIVPNGHSYSNPPEKQKVRRQLYWRIYELGWNFEAFGEVEKRLGDDNYLYPRDEQPTIDRYGKKYSWIAYFEIYGFREDNDLVKEEYPNFRPSGADIDPTFPVLPENKLYFEDDLLGDRHLPLIDWYKIKNIPSMSDYLNVKNLDEDNLDWICVGGMVSQIEEESNRKTFVVLQAYIVANEDYDDFLCFLKDKDAVYGNSNQLSENYYTYAGEMNTLMDSTYDNYRDIYFKIKRRKRKVKKGEEGYYPKVVFNKGSISMESPDEIEIEERINKEFKVLSPVSGYNWESYHSKTNQAGHQSVLSKELSFHLNLFPKPQTFDLFDDKGQLAYKKYHFHENYNSHQNFEYLRKDLLQKYLEDTNQNIVWKIWGEKQTYFENHNESINFYKKHRVDGYQKFKSILSEEQVLG
ncbi:hypothetical protein JM84_2027 [Dokdonia sp. Hel_I_63]|uniref:hypothetical protein n=1 Tax=unclassified Dokdonia TaxID=2615033 RepID=UPI00020A66B8|nr:MULTISPECIES: hypothetical protein [unclassified Dokdonia]AEE20634.1 hypothetical protein Krodi_2658 [Dokdonia sp. 4H-3-7-5]TVZ23110.1 hypothetical protein JM84_2027 [Dokdonia sp. Hel_I_63]